MYRPPFPQEKSEKSLSQIVTEGVEGGGAVCTQANGLVFSPMTNLS